MMRSILSVVSLLALPSFALAQGTKVKPRPSNASILDSSRPIVLSTRQLAGDFGRLNTVYTLGKGQPLNITVTGAEYSIDHAPYDSAFEGVLHGQPKAEEKALVVRLTIQNPVSQTQSLSPGSLKLTAVTPDGTSSERFVLLNPKTQKECSNLPLKPGQKLDVVARGIVPALEPIQKLIVQREEGTPVLRFDLTGKIAALPAWAGGGAAAKDVVAGIRDCVMPAAWFDVGLRGLSWTSDKLDSEAGPGEGERFLVAHLTFVGFANKAGLNFGTFNATLTTEDDQKLVKETPGGVGGFLLETRPVAFSGELSKGERQNLRIFFRVPREAVPKTLTLTDNETGRSIAFPTGQDWFEIRDCVRSVR